MSETGTQTKELKERAEKEKAERLSLCQQMVSETVNKCRDLGFELAPKIILSRSGQKFGFEFLEIK